MCSLHDDTKQACEHCLNEFDIETMTMSADDVWLCAGCVAEFKKVFDACNHDWEPYVDSMGDEGRICKRCSGFVVNDSPPAEGAEQATSTSTVERCAKAVCPLCADGRPINDKGDHVSKPGNVGGILLPNGRCLAWGIWQAFPRALAAPTADGEVDNG